MLLDDAIEDWGVANRSTLSGPDVEMLRRLWSTVRLSDCADLEIGKMEAKDRTNVMVLFDKSDRAGVASTLDKVTRWARTQTGSAQTRKRASVRPPRPPRKTSSAFSDAGLGVQGAGDQPLKAVASASKSINRILIALYAVAAVAVVLLLVIALL
ncbi:MAG: hypothetical protein HOI41_11155 [Acidimicrobiaceae bacterium]|nr:hypothetical protein [Acidimicrobiaceae bacterium]